MTSSKAEQRRANGSAPTNPIGNLTRWLSAGGGNRPACRTIGAWPPAALGNGLGAAVHHWLCVAWHPARRFRVLSRALAPVANAPIVAEALDQLIERCESW